MQLLPLLLRAQRSSRVIATTAAPTAANLQRILGLPNETSTTTIRMPGTIPRRSSRSASGSGAHASAPAPSRKVSTSRIAKAVSKGIAEEFQREQEGVGGGGGGGDDDAAPPPPPAKKRGRKSKAQKVAEEQEALSEAQASGGVDASADAAPTTAPKRGRKRAAPAAADTNGDGQDGTSTPPKRKGAKKEQATTNGDTAAANGNGAPVSDEPELDSDGEPVRRAKNGRRLPKKKPKEPKVYVIPDVVKRDFRTEFRPGSTDAWSSQSARANGFTGRLGYACLNTVLRTADPPIFSSRTARIKSIEEKGLDWVKDLARANARDIIPMLRWNAENHIRFMRLSSEIFPFASHHVYGYHPNCAAEELAEAGRVARELDHRVTMHPGQFCQLGSPNPAVIEASIRELDVHATVLDLMGMDQDSVMIIHGGGVYGNRPATMDRMRDTIRNKLPLHVKNRLVLENDEMSWSAEELLPICHEFNIPMVFDFHHDMLRPSKKTPGEFMPELLQLFADRGIKPKFHLSHPRPGSRNLRERRAHSDRCGSLPLDLPPDADLMIEAKDKEQAVLELYRIYDLHPVKHEVLRPPADDITTATSGRRKTLDGSGGATKKSPGARSRSVSPSDGGGGGSSDIDDAEADESTTPSKKKKKNAKSTPTKPTRELESDKVRRAIEHSKKIAAKRGIPYTGPEYTDAAAATQKRLEAGGPILNTQETMRVMEQEAEAIRQELKRTQNGRAVSEIRGEVEGNVVGDVESVLDDDGVVPPAERIQDPNEHNVPGQEEKVPYQPVQLSDAHPHPAVQHYQTPQKPANAGTVIIPTSAENVERIV